MRDVFQNGVGAAGIVLAQVFANSADAQQTVPNFNIPVPTEATFVLCTHRGNVTLSVGDIENTMGEQATHMLLSSLGSYETGNITDSLGQPFYVDDPERGLLFFKGSPTINDAGQDLRPGVCVSRGYPGLELE